MKPVRTRHHGTGAFHRGISAPRSDYFSKYRSEGKFGRLFPGLPPLTVPSKTEEELRRALVELGAPDGPMDPTGPAGPSGGDPENPRIPAGFVFFGQFVDHDITLDTTSSLERQNDPEGIQNFRTPVLELDNVYGSGPEATPWLYDGPRLLVEQEHGRSQLPRNSIGTALIGDPRNDENLVISQLQLAFLRFHNRIVDLLEDEGVAGENLFEEAQRIVRWHYQWIVLREFLPLTVGEELVDEVYTADCTGTGRIVYRWRHEPYIPVEFAVAAYRFGHSQVPGALQVNDEFTVAGNSEIPFFDREEADDLDPDDLSGFKPPSPRRYVDWKYLLSTGDEAEQPSQKIDRFLSRPLFDLPFIPATADSSTTGGPPENPVSLATRNLLRGLSFGLPSGQAVACALCEEPLAPGDLSDLADLGLDRQTPLFYYVLEEAEVRNEGAYLGPVGGRIVAEVLIGLLEGDRQSFVRANPEWTPAHEPVGTDESFGLADLIALAEG